jgi:transcriptional regulator with GAF, ATPase, and Fis domain
VISQYVPDLKGWKRSHQWFAKKFDSKRAIGSDGEIKANVFPFLSEHLMKEGSMVYESIEDLPAEWEEERRAAKTIGIKSGAAVSLRIGGNFLGAILIDSISAERAWPPDIVERLRFAGEIIANAINRKRTQEALDELIRFETLVSTLTAELSSVPVHEIDKVIEEGLELLGEFFGADRAAISQPLGDGEKYWPSHLWLSRRFDRDEHLAAMGGPFTPPPGITEHIRKNGFYVFSRLDELPDDWKEERRLFQELGAKSGAAVAMHVRGEIVGAINIATLQRERSWPPDIVQRLKFVGEIFARAFMCKRTEETIGAAFAEIERLKELFEDDHALLHEEIVISGGRSEIIGNSEAIGEVLEQVEQVAGTDSTVLLLGETGTGKELFANVIHDLSPCRERAMIMVNCAAMPSTLVESELFGREKGAYTGALTKQIGRFELAHKSTIFLDEVGELSPEVQAKLLRVIQERRFERLGSPESIEVDVRIIAATNKDLVKAVQEDKFREDLYYRLAVFPVSIPPLRKRQEDIPPLVWHFVKEFSAKMGKRIETISKKDMEALRSYTWPGNIRELRNVIERAMILCRGTTLSIEIPEAPVIRAAQAMTLDDLSRKHIEEVLEMTGWRIRGEGGAAAVLGLKPTTLEARMKKLGIERSK